MCSLKNASRVFLSCVIALVAASCWATEKRDPATRAAVIAPLVDSQTIAVVYFDFGRIDLDEVFANIQNRLKIPADLASKLAEALKPPIAALRKAGATEVYFIVNLVDWAQNSGPVMAIPLSADSQEKELTDFLLANRIGKVLRKESLLVAGSPVNLQQILDRKPDPRPDLANAFQAGGDAPFQVHFHPSKDQRRVLEEMLVGLPRQFGPAPGQLLAQGIRFGSLLGNKPNLSEWNLFVQAKDAESAKQLKELIVAVLAEMRTLPNFQHNAALFDQFVNVLTPKVSGDRLTIAFDDDSKGPSLMSKVVGPEIERTREAIRRSNSKTQLKQIGLAMHNYESAYKHLPAATIRDKQNQPLLSWRVMILPYLDQNKLYREFHLNEAWDSPHNKKLIERMPAVYRSASSKLEKPGMTTFLVPVGDKTMFSKPEGMRFREITDGTSNTIMVVDAADESAVVWTKPDDWAFDPKNPMRGLVGHYTYGFQVLLGDGSVRIIAPQIDPKTLRAVFTATGGEVTGDF